MVKRRSKNRLLILVLAVILILQGNMGVLAAAEEEQNGEELKENSWRYENGVPIEIEEQESMEEEIEIQSDLNITLRGIDVSEHQNNIDWGKVKSSGMVDFVIIRCGYGMNVKNSYTNEWMQDDDYWERNVSECERLGIPYGVYLYSYAKNVEQAKSEAEHVLRLIEGHQLSYPVYYDLEDDSIPKSDLAKIAEAFCSTIKDAGYPVGVYANTYWWNNYLTDPVFLNWHKWVAQYNVTCDYEKTFSIWQYSSEGSIPGISGNVDMNYLIGSPADHGDGVTVAYDDVHFQDWYRQAVMYVTDAGIMTGMSERVFGPTQELKRSHAATLIYRMAGSPAIRYEQRFPDVADGAFYSIPVTWTSSDGVGIMTGYTEGMFGLSDSITREQFVTILYRFAEYSGKDTSVRASLNDYPDAGYVTGFAKEAMQWAVGEGIIQGDNGRINPQGTTNRAECAMMLMRFLENVD